MEQDKVARQIRSDHGREFENLELDEFYQDEAFYTNFLLLDSLTEWGYWKEIRSMQEMACVMLNVTF